MSEQVDQQIREITGDGEHVTISPPPSHLDSDKGASLEPLSLEKAQRLAEFIGFLADTNRLRILSILAKQEMCVGDLSLAVGMTESAVSHQLRTLRAIRLVSSRRQGRYVFYRLQDDHVFNFYQAVVEHLDEIDP